MDIDDYVESCSGCRLSRELDQVTGGIAELDGNWILNQYSDAEGFLGWMAMQPRYHRMSFAKLRQPELQSFGSNVQRVGKALTRYWQDEFPGDPIERVYLVYFFESVFNDPPTNFHFHVHLIPRFKSLDPLLRDQSGINAWKIPTITNKKDDFPAKYQRNEANVPKLMEWLRKQLTNGRA